MDDRHIDRLDLRVRGLSEDESRQLVTLVVRGLSTLPTPHGEATHVSTMNIEVQSRPREGLESLSGRIVAEVRSRLEGSR